MFINVVVASQLNWNVKIENKFEDIGICITLKSINFLTISF